MVSLGQAGRQSSGFWSENPGLCGAQILGSQPALGFGHRASYSTRDQAGSEVGYHEDCDDGLGRRRRLFRRQACRRRGRCPFRGARRPSGRDAHARPDHRGRAGAASPLPRAGDQRSVVDRHRRFRADRRQAVGHGGRNRTGEADRRTPHGGHLVSERRLEGSLSSRRVRAQARHGRRRLCRDHDRSPRRDPADGADAAPVVRRAGRNDLRSRTAPARRLLERRHCRAIEPGH